MKKRLNGGMEDPTNFTNYVAGVIDMTYELLKEDKETNDKSVNTDNVE